jgi:hypothetical protein
MKKVRKVNMVEVFSVYIYIYEYGTLKPVSLFKKGGGE